MPDANPIAGLYPQPVRPEGNALAGDPLKILGAMGQLNALKQFQAQTAAGTAAQGAVNPDGSVDLSRYATGMQNPAIAPIGQQAVGSMLEHRIQQTAGDTQKFNLLAGQSHEAQAIIAGLNQIPGGPKAEDLLNARARLAATGMPPSIINSTFAGISNNPKDAARNIATIASTVAGPVAGAQRVPGQIDPVTGAVKTVPLAQTMYPGAGVAGAKDRSLQTSMSPQDTADQKIYSEDLGKSAQTLANVRPLQQSLPLVESLSHFNFGPGSNDIAKVTGLLTTLGITNVDPHDPLAVRQEVGKKLLQYARAAGDAGRSDNALSAAISSNPNLDLTQPANLALIKNQIAMDRVDAALPMTVNDFHGYQKTKTGYYPSIDQRAFKLDMMTPVERAALQKELGDPKFDKNGVSQNPAFRKFQQSYELAKKVGVTPPQATNGQ